MNRLIFLVDGFNVYHSVRDLRDDCGSCAKWLNLHSLCASFVSLFGREANLSAVYYFSAIPHYLATIDPGRIQRHETYIACLKDSGIEVQLGRFKQKELHCDKCGSNFLKHDEKETDVAVATKLLELFFTNACDTAVIMSGDTDLAPAVRTCQRLFPDKEIAFAFPYRRKNSELAHLTSRSFSVKPRRYHDHQFPDPVVLKDGRKVSKPTTW